VKIWLVFKLKGKSPAGAKQLAIEKGQIWSMIIIFPSWSHFCKNYLMFIYKFFFFYFFLWQIDKGKWESSGRTCTPRATKHRPKLIHLHALPTTTSTATDATASFSNFWVLSLSLSLSLSLNHIFVNMCVDTCMAYGSLSPISDYTWQLLEGKKKKKKRTSKYHPSIRPHY
jgi:hypothetical protein